MDFSLSSSLVGSAVLNPDKLSLDLQFATDKTLTARKGPTPTFTRGSTATFVGSNGLIQSAAVNAGRFNHDPITGVCKGLLIEESRTNVALYSGAIVYGTGWNTTEATSTASGTGPDGNTAYQISETALSSSHLLNNTGSTTVSNATSTVLSTVYTGSIFLKKVAGSVEWIQLTLGAGGFGTSQYANFNLSTGAYGSFAGLTAGTVPRIEAFPNGWYRCSITVTAIATTTTSAGVVMAFTNNTNTTTRLLAYSGTTANSVLAAMAQLEAGSFPTSYIPTVSSSVVRSADVCSITGSDFSGFYNPVEGTMITGASTNGFTANNNALSAIESGVGNVIRIINRVAQGNRLSAIVSGVTLTPASNYNTINVVYKTAVAASASGADYVIDGTQIPDVFTGSTLTADNLKFTGIASSTSNNTISSFRYYKKRLPVAKLQALTA
jgi:hypothetical protein